ncbi:MAG: MATE family efflux transporter [Oscillospiraceae bacterium]|jgi:putative MATE family efflux protein|nr:MATE family efflux transporter [Oscillospiraceae bacterium]
MIKTLRGQPRAFYKGLFALMLPLILQNLITQSVALADIFMVGMLGESSLAAVTLANAPFFVLMVLTFGIQSGVGILVAQYWGRGNKNAISRVLGVGLYFGLGAAAVAAVAMLGFPMRVLGFITPERGLVELGAQYARIVAVAQLFSGMNQIYLAAQRSCENTKIGMFSLASSALFNLFGNWVLIFGRFGLPAMGIRGAAAATLISHILGTVIILVYSRRDKRLALKLTLMLRPGVLIVRDFFKYSLPVVINEALWGVALMLYPTIFGHMPTPEALLAAYTIAGNLEKVFTVAVFATGNAASVVIGREIGAGREGGVYNAAKALLCVGLLLGLAQGLVLLGATLFLLEPFVYPLFTLSRDAARAATSMLLILSAVVPLRNVGFALGIGVLRGGGDVKAVMLIDVGTLYCLALPFAALSGLAFGAGVAVVYASVLIEEAVKTALLLRRFVSRKWINNVTRAIE